MSRPDEYRRTCSRCQTEWFLPRSAVKEKAPSRTKLRGAKLRSAGANVSLISFSRGRKAAAVTLLEEQQRRVENNGRCPSCGSVKFEQSAA